MPASLVKYAFFFPFDIFCFFIKDQVLEDVWIDIWVFYSFPLVLLSVFMPILDCFQYCSSVVEFEVRDCDASRSSFIVQDCFVYPGFLAFPYEIEYYSFKIRDEFCWTLCWICRLLLERNFNFQHVMKTHIQTQTKIKTNININKQPHKSQNISKRKNKTRKKQ